MKLVVVHLAMKFGVEEMPDFFLERSLNEENNSTGVYKYISIRIPLDYIFDCIKKYILLIYYKP